MSNTEAANLIFAGYGNCELCPRGCRVNRLAGDRGVCGETAVCRISSVGPHFGEEPPFSGSRGSGTVFFTGCPCRCFFCQNYQISLESLGEAITIDELYRRVMELAATGVHNLNFVTPTHFWPHLKELCQRLRKDGLTIPFLYNSSGYETVETVREAVELMDIFMPDFKYADPEVARRCMKAPDYPQTALAALWEMVNAKGFLEPFDPSGAVTARQGVLVRHLVLPGLVDNSLAVLQTLRREFGRMLPLSVMSQFRPMPRCHELKWLDRPVTEAEYAEVCHAVEELEFQQVFLQPYFHDSGFVPDFKQDDPFSGNSAG